MYPTEIWNHPERIIEVLNTCSDQWNLQCIKELGGLSGAYVFLAQNKNNAMLWVVKSFQEKSIAKQEHDKTTEAIRCFNRLGLVITELFPLPINGACFAMEMAGGSNANPLSDILFKNKDRTTAILENVGNKFRWSAGMNTISEPAFGSFDKHFNSDCCSKLNTLNENQFNEFHAWWNNLSVDANEWKIRIAPAHGDLHSENIIVSDSNDNDVCIIDFGNFCNAPILKDFSRLERDIRFCRFAPSTSGATDIEADYLSKQKEIDAALDVSSSDYLGTGNISDVVYIISKLRKIAENTIQNATDFEFNYSRMLEFIYFSVSPIKSRSRIQRKAAFEAAMRLKDKLERYFKNETLKQQEKALSYLSYTFLRLDQLPSGGWARSLPSWMISNFGDTQKVRGENALLPEIGGVNITCSALLNYTKAICKTINIDSENFNPSKIQTHNLSVIEHRNKVAENVVSFILSRITAEGAISPSPVKLITHDPDTEIHHTLCGLICLQLSYLLSGGKVEYKLFNAMRRLVKFLTRYHENVNREEHRRYSIYCACKQLQYLLSIPFFLTRDDNTRTALQSLNGVIDNMLDVLNNDSSYPETNKPIDSSNYLLNAPFLFKFDDSCLLLDDSYHNFLENPFLNLSEDHWNNDWGHTAEYYWLSYHLIERERLRTPAIETLFHLAEKGQFKFTHGASASHALGFLAKITEDELTELDNNINNLIENGITERSIFCLLLWIFKASYNDDTLPNFQNNSTDLTDFKYVINVINLHKHKGIINDLKIMLLYKLESGNYLSLLDDKHKQQWKAQIGRAVITTERFFEDELGIQNAKANAGLIPNKKWLHIDSYLLPPQSSKSEWILDIGCGSAAHANKFFFPKGYKVHFFDNSKTIISELSNELSATPPKKYKITNNRLERLSTLIEVNPDMWIEQYHMVFADAVAFHVPKESMDQVLSSLSKVIEKDGILFINFKVGDHTLISIDGRFFEYYSDYRDIQAMLVKYFSIIEETTMTSKESTMYYGPYPTYWAHFICRKK